MKYFLSYAQVQKMKEMLFIVKYEISIFDKSHLK